LEWGTPGAVFDALNGAWKFERVIEGKASMTGTARFSLLERGVLGYREEGRVRLADGQEFAAHREYLFARTAKGFEVLFAEEPPRLFHEIALVRDGRELVGTATHQCSDDRYLSSYRFVEGGSFVIRHQVEGPRKDYTSTTEFRPLPA
jgi:hypothetical protein